MNAANYLVLSRGVEPLSGNWKYPDLTDSRTEYVLVEDKRFELLTEACKATALPITPIPQIMIGFSPNGYMMLRPSTESSAGLPQN